jgi:hypothetical protein
MQVTIFLSKEVADKKEAEELLLKVKEVFGSAKDEKLDTTSITAQTMEQLK